MNDEMPPAGEDVLPAVDEVLADALLAQGGVGERALGLLRDAHRVLSGAGGLERPGEIAEACVRSAAEALLKLPGAPQEKDLVGVRSATRALLEAVEACPAPPVSAPAASGPASASPAPAVFASAPRTSAPDPAGAEAGAGDAAAGAAVAGWLRVREAAVALRGEVRRPGGSHRRRARGIAERGMAQRRTGPPLGAIQDKALDVWPELYSLASGTLHGAGADPGRPARLYTGLLAAARELLVPLPARAARVLELTAHQRPGRAEALEIARWSDARATAHFFSSQPAPVWLGVLAEHAPHLLDADPGAGGRWPAAPFLTHVARMDPAAARAWMSAHAEPVAAAGRLAVNAVLALACRSGAVVPAAQVRAVFQQAVPDGWAPHGPGDGWTARWTAAWARQAPSSQRDGDWIAVVEQLLAAAVDAEHTDRRRRQSADGHGPAGRAPASGVSAFDVLNDLRAQGEDLVGRPVGDLSVEAPRLLRALVAAAHGPGPHPRIRMIRAVAAGLLRRDLQAAAPAARHLAFAGDLDQVAADDLATFGGPRLARTVLDLAAADADAGVPLAGRTAQWKKFAAADPRLHARLLAAHLTAHRPPVPDEQWWTRALDLVPLVLADRPAPETARFAEALWDAAGPEETAELDRAAGAALGAAPAARHVDELLPAGGAAVDGAREPLTSWLRAWDWSPVLPARVLAGWEPLLAAVRRRRPAGPPDPRTAGAEPAGTVTAAAWEDLAVLAAERSPSDAAAALATAAAGTQAGADAYAMVLHRLVDADPARWTADVGEVLDVLDLPVLRAGYLAAAAAAAARPGAFPAGTLPRACAAALALRRTLAPQHPAPADRDRTAELLADQAVFDLLTHAWRTGADLAVVLPDALAHLRALAAGLTRPGAAPTAAEAEGDGEARESSPAGAAPPGPFGPGPAARALGCLLDYAAHHARTDGQMPRDILGLLAGALSTRTDHKAVSLVVGVRLPDLYRHAPDFTVAHRADLLVLPTAGRPSPAGSWLEWGRADPRLLAALGRAGLLAALRARLRGASEHLAHALVTDPGFLGDPATAWALIAGGPGGAAAASRLLEDLALLPARRPGAVFDTEVALWRAALAAGLPPGALAGAGRFARSDLADDVWLPLARASAEHTPTPVDASGVAERAAAHPGIPDALHLVAQLVGHPQHPWEDEDVLQCAHALLHAAAPGAAGGHRDAVEELRRALVEAGEVDAART
ncbi:hypothetical protein [Streptomyces sp. NPDC051662]|uniref:hypothetical protein n=1 Tax=Streptomyces sp. NPDC051662 TaxID=3154750 RepID=UPI00342804A5